MPGPARFLALAAAMMVTLTACGDDAEQPTARRDPAAVASARLDAEASTPRDDAETTTTTVGEIDPTTIQGAVINQFSLDLGDCFNRIEELRDGRTATITSRLDCDQPHGYQVFHELTYPAPHPSIYPGDTVMRDFAERSCYREFERWVGTPYELSELEIDVLTPTRTNFEDSVARYRGIHCWVYRLDGEPMVGNGRGSGW